METGETFVRRALSSKVIAVAVINGFAQNKGDWAAYIDAVAGQHHDEEWQEVTRSGNKLSKSVAIAIFSDVNEDCENNGWSYRG